MSEHPYGACILPAATVCWSRSRASFERQSEHTRVLLHLFGGVTDHLMAMNRSLNGRGGCGELCLTSGDYDHSHVWRHRTHYVGRGGD